MSAGEQGGVTGEAVVRRCRDRILALRDEIDLGDATAAEKASKQSQVVRLWTDIYGETGDQTDEKRLYHAHLALLALETITDAQRDASQNFIDRYNRDRDAELRAKPRRPPWLCWRCGSAQGAQAPTSTVLEQTQHQQQARSLADIAGSLR
eukprot:CAMPEP_0118918232 /NCGR_PEP_ID=MMETSP1166-20130328/17777_1 /TAXON_ID=1104430 /ORGANISM="Chrysoreinhardia sp, Strain CCMP3193" /LENGTH=150 /DNA_ID=CAMNT_0006858485 /DNA_START=6 /DNA_END=454 /DNA_ORIENTATION=+